MALFRVFRGHPEDLGDVPLVDGHSYVCYSDDSDIATFWTDIPDGNNGLRRIQIGGSGGGTDTEPLIATVETSSISAHAYSTGGLLILNDNLYRATADIAIGATLTVGTNIAATTVADEIASLKISIAGKYSKPSGGISSTDLASGVQTSLGKADTAYQKPSGGIPASDMASAVQTSLGKADTAYQKPSTGIPASDLASGVIPSVPSATSTSPKMDGTAAVGSETTWAKGDHVHPTDTSRAPTSHASTATTYGKGTDSNYGHLKLSAATNSTSGVSDGVAATPSAVKAAYDLANGKYTKPANGIPASDLASGVIPTVPSATSTSPKMDGTAAVGSETAWAKGDHVHPTDTSRAPTSHASSATTYGTGSNTNYGHLKLSASTSSTSGVSDGIAATPSAVKAAYDLANGKYTKPSGGIPASDIASGVIPAGLPAVTASDNGKIAMVVSGAWAVASLPIYDGSIG